MAYYFASRNLNVGGSTYKESAISFGEESTNQLCIDFRKKTFILFNQRDPSKLLVKEIPEEFIREDLYFFIELKNRGRIKMMK